MRTDRRGQVYARALRRFRQSVRNRKARREDPELWRVKHYAGDKMHGRQHAARCPCNPHHVQQLAKRLERVNTEIAEQTFSWFRGYARTINEMRPRRAMFLVTYYAWLRNKLLASGSKRHLNAYGAVGKKRQSKPYGRGSENEVKKKRKNST